jgi:hypothetical protein
MLREESPAFQGKFVENTWRRQLADGPYESDWGHGRVLIGEDGLLCYPCTYKGQCFAAFTAFMDLSLRLGCICPKVKTSPPAKIQKLCGLLYNTTRAPSLHIPLTTSRGVWASLDFLIWPRRCLPLAGESTIHRVLYHWMIVFASMFEEILCILGNSIFGGSSSPA